MVIVRVFSCDLKPIKLCAATVYCFASLYCTKLLPQIFFSPPDNKMGYIHNKLFMYFMSTFCGLF